MRVISLVPSWTETLIEAGIEVVGRSRYCIHPEARIKSIPAVGGTKDINWERVGGLNADIILMDREENTKAMADQSPLPIVDTHIESLENLVSEFINLAGVFNNSELLNWSTELTEVLKRPLPRWTWKTPPAIIEWIKKPKKEPKDFVYLIWRNPWMCVGQECFIGSMIKHLGGGDYHHVFGNEKYPQVDLDSLDPDTTMLLCSSEPYPFAKKKQELIKLPFSSALVDGESYSWFGLRSLRFLSTQKNSKV